MSLNLTDFKHRIFYSTKETLDTHKHKKNDNTHTQENTDATILTH